MVNKYFPGTATLIGGLSLNQIQEETLNRYAKSLSSDEIEHGLDVGGEYAFRIRGEKHSWSPDTITSLQKAVRINSKESFLVIFQLKLTIITNQCLLLEVYLSSKIKRKST